MRGDTLVHAKIFSRYVWEFIQEIWRDIKGEMVSLQGGHKTHFIFCNISPDPSENQGESTYLSH